MGKTDLMAPMTLFRVTFPDLDSARAAVKAALEERLVACANLGEITSEFHWAGATDSESEVAVLFKTRPDLVEALCGIVRASHPYDLPVLTWWDVQTDAATADWLKKETRA